MSASAIMILNYRRILIFTVDNKTLFATKARWFITRRFCIDALKEFLSENGYSNQKRLSSLAEYMEEVCVNGLVAFTIQENVPENMLSNGGVYGIHIFPIGTNIWGVYIP